MKIKKIIIQNELGNIQYRGPLMGLDFNQTHIKNRCLELFNDDDPCVIHASYAVQSLTDDVEKRLLSLPNTSHPIDQAFILKYPELDVSKFTGSLFIVEVKP